MRVSFIATAIALAGLATAAPLRQRDDSVAEAQEAIKNGVETFEQYDPDSIVINGAVDAFNWFEDWIGNHDNKKRSIFDSLLTPPADIPGAEEVNNVVKAILEHEPAGEAFNIWAKLAGLKKRDSVEEAEENIKSVVETVESYDPDSIIVNNVPGFLKWYEDTLASFGKRDSTNALKKRMVFDCADDDEECIYQRERAPAMGIYLEPILEQLLKHQDGTMSKRGEAEGVAESILTFFEALGHAFGKRDSAPSALSKRDDAAEVVGEVAQTLGEILLEFFQGLNGKKMKRSLAERNWKDVLEFLGEVLENGAEIAEVIV